MENDEDSYFYFEVFKFLKRAPRLNLIVKWLKEANSCRH